MRLDDAPLNQPNIVIPFSQPSLDMQELEAVTRVLESKWLTTGREALAFEKEFERFLTGMEDTTHAHDASSSPQPVLRALAVHSCSTGLHLAYSALGADAQHSVICTPLTFIASVSPAIHCGAKIEFIDVAPDSLYPNADSLDTLPVQAQQHILTLVPIAGYHPYYQELFDCAAQRNLYTLEDAAHAFPAMLSYEGRMRAYGAIADIGVYSFYANKTITSGEGGMIVSRNVDYIEHMSRLRTHGMNRLTWDRHKDKPEQFSYDISEIGYKYNLPDILACIGRVQLHKAFMLQEARSRIAQRYTQVLSTRDYWVLPDSSQDSTSYNHAWHVYIIQIVHPRLTRDDVMKKLREKGIATSVHYTPLHLMSYFQRTYGVTADDFPNATQVFQRILSIPMYPDLTESQVDFVCESLLEIGDTQ